MKVVAQTVISLSLCAPLLRGASVYDVRTEAGGADTTKDMDGGGKKIPPICGQTVINFLLTEGRRGREI